LNQQNCLLHTDPQWFLNVLQPTSGSVFSMYPILQARASYHITSWHTLQTVMSKNRFYSGHTILIVILHAETTLSLSVVASEMLGSMWHST
jgi:hypothetical protein